MHDARLHRPYRILERVKVNDQPRPITPVDGCTRHVLVPEAASSAADISSQPRRGPRDLQTGRRGWLRPLLSHGS